MIRRKKTGEQLFTYYRVTKDGRSKMYDLPKQDDQRAIEDACNQDLLYGGQFPTYRVERWDRTVIYERKGK